MEENEVMMKVNGGTLQSGTGLKKNNSIIATQAVQCTTRLERRGLAKISKIHLNVFLSLLSILYVQYILQRCRKCKHWLRMEESGLSLENNAA